VSDQHPTESLAAYALSAVPDDERTEIEAHLERCPVCRAELDELSAVTSALAEGVPAFPAPAPLRDRLMTTVRAEAELLQAAGPEADRPVRPREERKRTWGFGRLRIGPAGALAGGVAVLIAAVLGFAIGGGRNSGSHARVVSAQVSPAVGAAARAQLEVSGSHTTLRVAHFASPGRGRVYQVWLKPGVHAALRATPELFTVGRDGRGAVELSRAARSAYRIMVTSEPAGGSPSGQPSRPPVLQASL
jgi:Anti-sigma-K factor rskA/Putative zinc-finger